MPISQNGSLKTIGLQYTEPSLLEYKKCDVHYYHCQIMSLAMHKSFNYIPRRKSGIYWIQVRRAAAAVEISLCTR